MPSRRLKKHVGSCIRSKTKVNSFHHQAVDRLARPLQKTAWSPDGIIEGIEHVGQRLLAVQWHPDFAYDALLQEQAVSSMSLTCCRKKVTQGGEK